MRSTQNTPESTHTSTRARTNSQDSGGAMLPPQAGKRSLSRRAANARRALWSDDNINQAAEAHRAEKATQSQQGQENQQVKVGSQVGSTQPAAQEQSAAAIDASKETEQSPTIAQTQSVDTSTNADQTLAEDQDPEGDLQEGEEATTCPDLVYKPISSAITARFEKCTDENVSDVLIAENPELEKQGKRGVAIEGHCVEVVPGCLNDIELCAHELTHIVQQRGPTEAKTHKHNKNSEKEAINPEKEAINVSNSILMGQKTQITIKSTEKLLYEENIPTVPNMITEKEDVIHKEPYGGNIFIFETTLSGINLRVHYTKPSPTIREDGDWTQDKMSLSWIPTGDEYIKIKSEGLAEAIKMNKILPSTGQIKNLWVTLKDVKDGIRETAFRYINNEPSILIGPQDIDSIGQSIRHEAIHALFSAYKRTSKLNSEPNSPPTLLQKFLYKIAEIHNDFEYYNIHNLKENGKDYPYLTMKNVSLNAGWGMISPENWGIEAEHPESNYEEYACTAIAAFLTWPIQLMASINYSKGAVLERKPDDKNFAQLSSELVDIMQTFKLAYESSDPYLELSKGFDRIIIKDPEKCQNIVEEFDLEPHILFEKQHNKWIYKIINKSSKTNEAPPGDQKLGIEIQQMGNRLK
jgi:hypothetical protein